MKKYSIVSSLVSMRNWSQTPRGWFNLLRKVMCLFHLTPHITFSLYHLTHLQINASAWYNINAMQVGGGHDID